MTAAAMPILALAEEAGFSPFAYDPAATILTIATFVILLLILSRFAWKPILAAIEQREKRIEDAIGKAEADRKEAERLLADYQARVANVQGEVAALLEKGRLDAEALLAEARTRAEAEAAAVAERARREIDSARLQALLEIRKEAVGLGLAVASKVVGKSLDDADRRRLAQDVVSDLTRAAAGKN
jgi:F-type H+-transporting ATPase subunit b